MSATAAGAAPASPGDPDGPSVPAPTAGSSTPALPGTVTSGRYVVALAKAPVATYTGGEQDIPATKPQPGAKVDVTAENAQRYSAVLNTEHQEVAASVGAAPEKSYTTAFNGFAADLTGEQVAALQKDPAVVSVTKDTLRVTTDDHRSTDFLKLSGSTGLWSTLGGPNQAGKGVVIGVIDTGIWPENPSFKGDALGTAPDANNPYKAYRQGDTIIAKKVNGGTFTGTCQTGEQFSASLCNTKIISARYFGDAYLGSKTPLADFKSPRDGAGHGSHTAGTAAGNNDVYVGAQSGRISGVAPGASIAVYKALWEAKDPTLSGGFTSDLVAAIDQAVADGVDVINYSVGAPTESPATDPVALAFLSAASAGIFVSASAGNSGAGASTLDNTQPWVTTVAASTVQRYEAKAKLGNGVTYTGVSTTVGATVGPKPFVAAQNSAVSGTPTDAAARCYTGVLDPAKVAGKIVQCDRGGNARLEKSAEVKRAGGVGMVLTDLQDLGPIGDSHSVPSIEIDIPDGQKVKDYALTSAATATLVPSSSSTIPYPQIIGFSSRGPALATNQDVLKPDLAAPGVDILAAVAPPSNDGKSFARYSGTSMAAPHVAGLAAIIRAKNPTWSPMAVKSALMTTATDTKTRTGAANTDVFAQGAGNANPSSMLSPGLVYDSSDNDWLAYLEGLGTNLGTGVTAKDPSDYNAPSFAVGQLAGSQTLTRTVTATTPGLYRATASVPGYTVKITPSILNFDTAGKSLSFTATFTRTTAPLSTYAMGSVTWQGAGKTVRAPVALRSTTVASTSNKVDITGSGSASWQVTSAFSGAFPITAYGLAPVNETPDEVSVTQSKQYAFTVPSGSHLARFQTVVAAAGADIDLYLYRKVDGKFQQVAASASGSANEKIELANPPAGDYVVAVLGYTDPPGQSSTPFILRSAIVTNEVGKGISVSPSNPNATAGQAFTVTATTTVPDPSKAYVGWVQYPDLTGTLVEVAKAG
ncbi:S8 family serine peptidase [Nakamurella flava]|uniref:S8 family serine peptidase n=1 Tax=Nakamurella flava TaxID=2576308 RepID=UPI00197BCCE4|nr:S8 family serine peptidase [Nakamurella flava]